MKLNHLNLVVINVGAATSFFETYFGFKCVSVMGDNIIAVLKGDDDFTLVIMPENDNEPAYPKAFHIGFMQPSTEAVDALHKKLKAGNIRIEGEPKKIRDSYGFYFHFGNVMIEVGYYL